MNKVKLLGKTLFQSGKDFLLDNGPQWAAAISYYSLLSVFPLMLAAAAIASLFVDQNWIIGQATRFLGNFLPRGAGEIRQIVQDALQARGSIGIISVVLLLWSGSRVFGVVMKALNIAYDVDDVYGFIKRTAVELVMMLTIGLLFILALASRLLLKLIWTQLNLDSTEGTLFQVIQSSIPALLLLVTFYLTYQYVPRKRTDWTASLSGAVLAAALFLIAQPLFTTYIRRFANYNLIYGSLAVVIVIILWAWVSAMILLFCGEVVSHIQDMVIEEQPEEVVEERHKRRSPSQTLEEAG